MASSGEEDDALPVPAVEALSAGRAKRSTAGNRMRELLEQERERIGADDAGASARVGSDVVQKTQVEDSDENAIFGEDEGENDVDFEEGRGADEAEDIIDSDFDQSSNDGIEDEAEDEGEQQLLREEKAAKKASRARAKALPAHMRQRPVAMAPNEHGPSESRSRGARRIAFAASTMTDAESAAKRASKRTSTMQVSQDVHERLQQDEERRAKLRETAQPKRKKVRLSQADYIAEALEIEESNRESLKIYLEREEERRERERKRSKKRMEGPFLRWRSFAVDCHAVHQRALVREEDEAARLERDGTTRKNEASLVEDPVIAARKAANEERERMQRESTAEQGQGWNVDGQVMARNYEGVAGSGSAEQSQLLEERGGQVAAQYNLNGNTESAAEIPATREKEMDDRAKGGAESSTDDIILAPGSKRPQAEDGTSNEEGKKISQVGDDDQAKRAMGAESCNESNTLDRQNSNDGKKRAACAEAASIDTVAPDDDQQSTRLDPDWEARAYVSLHNIPTATPWPIVFSQVLGPHVDWSRYPIVPARNRPLRPRQSACPVTGLPARYRDPRTGVAYATKEAYVIIGQLMRGEYRWSCSQGVLKDADAAKTRITNPLDLGCYLDRLDEVGACNVLLTASSSMPIQATVGSVEKRDAPTRAAPPIINAIGQQLAPGDEQAVMAAASELPAGSTRSGSRRSGRS